MPISQILLSNPAWIRGSVEDVVVNSDMVQDVKANGIRVPLLLEPDDFLIDGACRLTAAEAAGLDTVPVLYARDWETVREYYKEVQRLTLIHSIPAAAPLQWLDLHHLISNVLYKLYQPYQTRQSAQTRRERIVEAVITGKELTPARVEISYFANEIADMFGFRPADVKIFRDLMGVIERMLPADRSMIIEAFPTTSEEVSNLGLVGVYRNNLRKFLRGELPQEEMFNRIHLYRARHYQSPSAVESLRARVAMRPTPKPRKRGEPPVKVEEFDIPTLPVSLQEIQQLVQLLDHVSLTAVSLGAREFKPLKADDITAVVKSMRLSVARLNRFARAIETLSGEKE